MVKLFAKEADAYVQRVQLINRLLPQHFVGDRNVVQIVKIINCAHYELVMLE